ncbi:MAG: hypothetical protein HY590_00595 [Candidatus Omnitrophica bacterium]|nr:hypothetical protein [Candidatus Omnitrophota bacterium]
MKRFSLRVFCPCLPAGMVLSCVLGLSSFLYAEEAPVILEYHYTPGQVLHYRHEVSMRGNLEGEVPQSFSSKVSSRITMEVKEVGEDGSARMDVRYDTLEFSQGTGQEGEESGTAGATQDSPFKDLIGKTMSVRLTRDGKMLEVEGEPVAGQMDPSFKQIFGQMEGIFPDHPVQVGDSWTRELQLPIAGIAQRVKASFQNKLESFEMVGQRKCAKIKSTLSLSLPEGAFTPPGGLAEGETIDVSVKMEGQGEVIQYFDVSEGVVVKTEGSTLAHSTQSLTLPPAEGTAPQTIQTVSNMEMTFKTELE